MRVSVQISRIRVQGDYAELDGLCLKCERCNKSVEVYGTGGASVRRGMVMLKEGCDERNYYEKAPDPFPPAPVVSTKDLSTEELIEHLRRAASIWFKNEDLLMLEELIRRSQRAHTSPPPVE